MDIANANEDPDPLTGLMCYVFMYVHVFPFHESVRRQNVSAPQAAECSGSGALVMHSASPWVVAHGRSGVMKWKQRTSQSVNSSWLGVHLCTWIGDL